jgi:hydrogenase expression/formation protein HypC
MCLAIPMRITATDGPDATIEADGLVQRTSLMLVPDARVGDYVLVHAGFAIAVLDSEEATERLALFDELAGLAGEPGGPAGSADRDAADATAEADDGHPEDPSI